jgi:alpha-tubulin suppressor-like RCC1 family protein
MHDKPTEFGQFAQQFESVRMSGDNGYAITITGEVWIWGKNANGELGVSDYEPRVKPYPLITMEKEKVRDIYIG